jgi:hypothetical protein
MTPSAVTSPSTEASHSPTPTESAPAVTPSTAALAITAAAFHAGEVFVSYPAVNLAATGGVPPYQWQISTGFLPSGLQLSGSTVSGTPNQPNTWYFTVKVLDSAGHSATAARSIAVYRALAMTARCATKCVIGAGCTKCGVFGTVSQGLGPYSYRIVGGAVPRGMTWKQLSLVGPFPAGGWALSVLVTDHLGGKVTVGATWSIYIHATLARGRSSDCISFGNPPACTATGWSYTGGNPTAVPKVVIYGYKPYCATFCYQMVKAPPPGWKVTIRSGTIVFQAGGIACNAIPTYYAEYLTLELVDTAACATTSPSNRVDLLVDIENNC